MMYQMHIQHINVIKGAQKMTDLYTAFTNWIGTTASEFSDTGQAVWYDPAYIAVCVLAVVFVIMVFRFLFSIIHAGGRIRYE